MREYFPFFKKNPDLIYLDSAATAHKPRPVIEELSHFYREEYATVHRAIYRPSLIATEKYNGARKAVQEFLNASFVEEIIFTRGTTDAINLVARSYGDLVLEEGDEIIISEMEHHSNIVPWQMLAKRKKAHLAILPMDRQGVLDWKGKITSRTKIVALAHVSNVTGTINPIQEIAQEAHAHGAVLVVDGAQSAPHMPVDVQQLGCDFYAFSGHKCYGPTGIGALYGKKELLHKMPPLQGGGDMIEKVTFEETTYKDPPLRFEAGTPAIAPAIALKAALDFLTQFGREKARLHGQALLEAATVLMQKIPLLHILGTAPKKGPLITFHVEGVHPLDLATLLDMKNIAIRSGHLCAQPVLRKFGLDTAARVSFGLYNTLDEVELFFKALEKSLSQLVAAS